MSTVEPFSNLPGKVRDLLEGNGRKLEAFEVVVGPPSFFVLTRRADYGDRPAFKDPPGVVKFSSKQHAITVSTHIKLGSSRYYREYEDDDTGIADPEEGRLKRGSLSEFCEKNGLSAPVGSEMVTSTVSWARNDFLMFCTSVAPQGLGLGDLRSRFPDYDCATFIPEPSAFAMQLGKDIGKQLGVKNLRLDALDMIIKRLGLDQAKLTSQGRLLQRGLDTRVMVTHGPIVYCDPPERIINRFPIERRGEVIPFVKRRKYSGQREYRFVVEVMGKPKELKVPHFLMEITDELRSLAETYPRVSVPGMRDS